MEQFARNFSVASVSVANSFAKHGGSIAIRGPNDLKNLEDGYFHKGEYHQPDVNDLNRSRGSSEGHPQMYLDEGYAPQVFFKPETAEIAIQAVTRNEQQHSQTEQWFHLSNFSTALRLTVD